MPRNAEDYDSQLSGPAEWKLWPNQRRHVFACIFLYLISNIILIQSIYLNKVDNKKDHHIYKINFIPMLMNQAVWMDSRDKGGEN